MARVKWGRSQKNHTSGDPNAASAQFGRVVPPSGGWGCPWELSPSTSHTPIGPPPTGAVRGPQGPWRVAGSSVLLHRLWSPADPAAKAQDPAHSSRGRARPRGTWRLMGPSLAGNSNFFPRPAGGAGGKDALTGIDVHCAEGHRSLTHTHTPAASCSPVGVPDSDHRPGSGVISPFVPLAGGTGHSEGETVSLEGSHVCLGCAKQDANVRGPQHSGGAGGEGRGRLKAPSQAQDTWGFSVK